MSIVYAVVFSDKTVRIGCSDNLHRRMRDLVTDANRTGVMIVAVVLSTVQNGRRAASDLMAEADDLLTLASDGGYVIQSGEDVVRLFDSARLPWMACPVTMRPFAMMVDERSFCGDLDWIEFGAVVQMSKVERAVMDYLTTRTRWVTRADVMIGVTGHGRYSVSAALDGLIDTGHVVRRNLGGDGVMSDWRLSAASRVGV